MNSLEIEAFLAIVDTKGISKAADKLYISQSTVSHRLNSLENKIGETLIIRSKGIKEIRLTPKGNEFLSFANRYMYLKKDIATWKLNSAKYELKVAGPICLNCYTLRDFYISLIAKDYPLALKINTNWDSTIHNLLESYDLDIAITSRPRSLSSLISEPVFSEKLVMISDIRYSNYSQYVDASTLDIRDEIYMNWGDNYKIWHNQIWNSLELPKLTIDSPNLASFFLQDKEAWAIVPLSVAINLNSFKNLRISMIYPAIPNRIIYKITQREQSPASKKAINIFEKELKEFLTNNNEIIKI
ncbi:MAG: LysR family transcriptional regulator [Tissierellia bacterium]|nr:LysR family transcriptional regulator [Tissierellia bacterium]